MSNYSHELTLMSPNILDINLLLDYLKDFPEISINKSNEKNDFENAFFITQDIFLGIKRVPKEKYIKILNEMKVNCEFPDLLKSILNVLENNRNLIIITEIISHGITYFDANEKINSIINEIKQVLETTQNTKSKIKANDIKQVILGDFKLEYLIFLILNNYNKPLVFTSTYKGRSIISCFILLTLLHKDNPSLTNQLAFLFPENENIGAKSVISTDDYIVLSGEENLVESFNRNSCYFIMNDCDLHSATVNYLNALGGWFVRSDRPSLCLVQENVYEKFISLLKAQLETSKEADLFDKNRHLSLVYSMNIDFILEFLKTDSNINLLTSAKSQNGKYFHPLFIFDKVQPQNEFFSNKHASELCSFILTFRNCEEGLMLANKLFRGKASLYLWTENISQCFEMKSKLEYEKIYVNMINIRNSQFHSIKINCNSSLISRKKSEKSIFLLARKISDKLEFLKSKIENKDFSSRYRKINEILDRLKLDKLIDEKQSVHIRGYLEILINKLKSNYKVDGNIHTIIEQAPIGNVILYLGDVDINGSVIQLILSSWLFGNNVLVISSKDFHNVEMNNMKSLAFLNGKTSISELNKCLIDSVIALNDLETDDNKQELGNLKFLLYHKVVDSHINNIDGLLDDVTNFILKYKSMFILSGGINTK